MVTRPAVDEQLKTLFAWAKEPKLLNKCRGSEVVGIQAGPAADTGSGLQHPSHGTVIISCTSAMSKVANVDLDDDAVSDDEVLAAANGDTVETPLGDTSEAKPADLRVELEVATDEPVAPLLVETDAQLDIQDPVDMEADDEVLQIGELTDPWIDPEFAEQVINAAPVWMPEWRRPLASTVALLRELVTRGDFSGDQSVGDAMASGVLQG
eukprot:Skav232755  [mRNA]  locus=scaffold1229:23882:32399:+ [translate_table: standard]